MALKGNLLFNGDFETGTTEDWVFGPFGRGCANISFTASAEAKLYGEYGGLLTATADDAYAELAYNKTVSFEEYEAFLYILPCKMTDLGLYNAELYGLDDKGNLIEAIDLVWRTNIGDWAKLQTLLRGFGNITHFQIGLFFYSFYSGGKLYFDEVKLIPLKSIKGHVLRDKRSFTNVTTNREWDSILCCIGRCQLRSIVKTANVSGSSPTLDVTIKVYLFDPDYPYLTYSHTQFTGEDIEEIVVDLPEAALIRVNYILGGSSPSFDITHLLRLIPL